MVICFLLCDFYHIKKKKKLMEGAMGGSLRELCLVSMEPEEWEGVGRVNRGSEGRAVCAKTLLQGGAGLERRPPAWMPCLLLEALPEKDLWWVPSITLPCELWRASSRLAPRSASTLLTLLLEFCEENTFVKRLKQIVLTCGSVP